MSRGLPLVLVLLLTGCPSATVEPVDADPILARVGSRVIRFHQLQAAARSRGEPGLLPRSGAGWEDLRARLLKEQLVEEVLLTEAELRSIALPDGAVDAEVARSTDDVGDSDRLERFVVERHGTHAAWVASVERRLRLDAVERSLRLELSEAVVIAPEQVDSARSRFEHALHRPARVRMRQVFFPDAEAARGALLQLQEGADFAELARSLTGEDGDTGSLAEDSVPPQVLAAVAGLSPGATTDVVPSPLGYHLYQLVEQVPGGPLIEDEARAEIERRLRLEAVDSRLKAWLAARTDALGLFVDEEALAQVRCCRQGLPYAGDAEDAP